VSLRPIIAALALAALATPAGAQTYAITNARIATMTADTPIEGGTVIVSRGIVTAVGTGVPVPGGAEVIDAKGGWVTPGIFAGFSRLGIIEIDAVDETNDARAGKAKLSAAIDVARAVNPKNVNIPINRIAGVTRAVVVPEAGTDIFAGQGAIIGLGANPPPTPVRSGAVVSGRVYPPTVIRDRAFQYVELGERGADIAGGSRPAAFSVFHEALSEARDLPAGKGFGASGMRDSDRDRADIEALRKVVQGRQLLLVHVERGQDILNVLALKSEFPSLRLVIVGAGEGWTVAREIAAANVPVITRPLSNLPSRFETLAATQSNVGRMVAAGVRVALGEIDDDDARQLRLLPQGAGNLVALAKLPGASGLTPMQALATITRAPADIFGLPNYGRITPGAVADIVVWSGDPLELSSRPVSVMIDGKPQPMTSRQTELRDRYLGLDSGDMTLHYKK